MISSIDQIREGVTQALKTLKDSALQTMPTPYTLEIRYRIPLDAYAASFYPGAALVDDDTVRFETGEWFEVLRALQFLK